MPTDFGGLPIASLQPGQMIDQLAQTAAPAARYARPPAAGEVGGPAAEAVIGGETVTLGRMVQNPMTGETEPYYGDVPGFEQPAAPPLQQARVELANMDPLDVIEANRQARMQRASVFDRQIALAQEPLQQQLDTLDKQMQVDINTIYGMDLDGQSRDNRINQKRAEYQKRAIQAQDKVAPQITRLQQAKDAAMADAQLQAALATAHLAGATTAARKANLSPGKTMALRLNAVGVDVPMTIFESGATQTPEKQVVNYRKQLDALSDDIDDVFVFGKGGELRVRKPPEQWADPTASWGDINIKKDTEPATPEQAAMYKQMSDMRANLRKKIHDLNVKRFGVQVQDLGAGISPIADGIKTRKRSYPMNRWQLMNPQQPRPAQRQQPLTEAVARQLLAEAGGDKDAARRLADERGYSR